MKKKSRRLVLSSETLRNLSGSWVKGRGGSRGRQRRRLPSQRA